MNKLNKDNSNMELISEIDDIVATYYNDNGRERHVRFSGRWLFNELELGSYFYASAALTKQGCIFLLIGEQGDEKYLVYDSFKDYTQSEECIDEVASELALELGEEYYYEEVLDIQHSLSSKNYGSENTKLYLLLRFFSQKKRNGRFIPDLFMGV